MLGPTTSGEAAVPPFIDALLCCASLYCLRHHFLLCVPPLQGLVGLGSGALADKLIHTRGCSVRAVRVGLQLAGMLGPAACLMAAVSPLVGGSAATASALITVGLGLSALSLGAVSVNHLDIAPRHAGMVFGAGELTATALIFGAAHAHPGHSVIVSDTYCCSRVCWCTIVSLLGLQSCCMFASFLCASKARLVGSLRQHRYAITL